MTTAYLTGLESQLEVTLAALKTHQAKIKTAEDAGVAVERARVIVQDALGTLQLVARTVVTEGIKGDLTQLHLNDPLPRAMDLLILQARAAFEGAQEEPYASLLATAAPAIAAPGRQNRLETGWGRRRGTRAIPSASPLASRTIRARPRGGAGMRG